MLFIIKVDVPYITQNIFCLNSATAASKSGAV